MDRYQTLTVNNLNVIGPAGVLRRNKSSSRHNIEPAFRGLAVGKEDDSGSVEARVYESPR